MENIAKFQLSTDVVSFSILTHTHTIYLMPRNWDASINRNEFYFLPA